MAETLIHVKGLKVLDTILATLPIKLEKNIMRGAMRAGAKPIQAAAISGIHNVSFELARSLKISTSARNGVVKAYLRTGGIGGYIAMWVEFGTRPHWIKVPEAEKPTNWRRGVHFGKKVSMTTINRTHRSLRLGLHFIGPTVWHKGAQKKPFMRPAFDGQVQAAIFSVADYIKTRLMLTTGIDTSGITIGDGEDNS